MRIRLFNVKYSPNLGDGLLSECLEQALWSQGANPSKTYSVDLGARTGYESGSSSRGLLLKVLQATPPVLRRAAMRVVLASLAQAKWEPHYRANLNGVDAVVVGGGNLFTDMDLNFPVKIRSTFALAAASELPIAIYGVGVSAHWSRQGLKMVNNAIARANLCYVSVRDDASKRNFDRQFGRAAGREAVVVRDPGLMISRFVPAASADVKDRAIGLCVTSAIALNYHSALKISDEELLQWYLQLCKRIVSSGHRVVVFTNGSPEDVQFLDEMSPLLLAIPGERMDIRRVHSPTDLAILVSGLSSLIAHRMHALIAAFSFGVPIYALQWDSKVDAFMASVNLADRIAAASGKTYEVVADEAVGSAGRPAAVREQVVQEAYSDVGGLYRALKAAL